MENNILVWAIAGMSFVVIITIYAISRKKLRSDTAIFIRQLNDRGNKLPEEHEKELDQINKVWDKIGSGPSAMKGREDELKKVRERHSHELEEEAENMQVYQNELRKLGKNRESHL